MAKARPTRRTASAQQSTQQRSPEPTVEETEEVQEEQEESTLDSSQDSEQQPQESQQDSKRSEPPVETVAGETTGTKGQGLSTNVDSDGTTTTSPSADGPGVATNIEDGETPTAKTEPTGAVEVQSSESNKATAAAMKDETDQDAVPSLPTTDGKHHDTPFKGGETDFNVSGSNIPRVAEPDGLILDEDEPLRIEADTYDNYAIVNKDVFRRHYPRNSKRPTFVQLYVKGQQMSLSALQKIG